MASAKFLFFGEWCNGSHIWFKPRCIVRVSSTLTSPTKQSFRRTWLFYNYGLETSNQGKVFGVLSDQRHGAFILNNNKT